MTADHGGAFVIRLGQITCATKKLRYLRAHIDNAVLSRAFTAVRVMSLFRPGLKSHTDNSSTGKHGESHEKSRFA
jgi:hypothetical protein